MPLYFAYGSNMKHSQMRDRCGKGWRFLKRAYLPGYKLVFDGYSEKWKGAVANVVKSEGETVWGGLFEVTEECIGKLNKCEGHPKHYKRQKLQVFDDDGNCYTAYVYLREPQGQGKPSRKYLEALLQGAKDCGLSHEYVEWLKQHEILD
ncbi:putative conserved protein YtfP, gamma-glutamylcyclotransferase (GGCT)/AIG2-like family [Candidatus Fervidibacteria bacterium JGI MDM2 JNZ-1-D12]